MSRLVSFIFALLVTACTGMDTLLQSNADCGTSADETYASIVIDKGCTQIVQPFTLTQNMTELKKCALQSSFKGGLENILKGNPDILFMGEVPDTLRIYAKRLNWLPMTAEVMYGERLHNEETNILRREHRLGKKYYPIADKMLEELLSNIGEDHEYEFKLFILKNSGGNAIARPGGFLYIDQGLIESSALHPKAYFALAHEIAHVLQRHETKELQSLIIDSIDSTKDLLNLLTSVGTNPEAIFKHIKITKDLFTRHYIDQELQADACSIRLLARTFMNNQKLTESVQVFLKDLPPPELKEVVNSPEPVYRVLEIVNEPIKRHPNTKEREENLNAIYHETVGETASSN